MLTPMTIANHDIIQLIKCALAGEFVRNGGKVKKNINGKKIDP